MKHRDCGTLRRAIETARARLSTRKVALGAGGGARSDVDVADEPTEFDAELWREIAHLERGLREAGCA